jgi:uncharacterized protein with HEPN domain
LSRHDPIQSLKDMRDHAFETLQFVEGKTQADLQADRLLSLAVVRLLEIVGEAARRVPLEKRSVWPNIPWLDIVGLRNRLSHAYDLIDFDVVWLIIEDDLPPLIRELDAILGPADADL